MYKLNKKITFFKPAKEKDELAPIARLTEEPCPFIPKEIYLEVRPTKCAKLYRQGKNSSMKNNQRKAKKNLPLIGT